MQMKYPVFAFWAIKESVANTVAIEIPIPCELIVLKYIMILWKNTNMYTYVSDIVHSQQTPKCMLYPKAKDPKLIQNYTF